MVNDDSVLDLVIKMDLKIEKGEDFHVKLIITNWSSTKSLKVSFSIRVF